MRAYSDACDAIARDLELAPIRCAAAIDLGTIEDDLINGEDVMRDRRTLLPGAIQGRTTLRLAASQSPVGVTPPR